MRGDKLYDSINYPGMTVADAEAMDRENQRHGWDFFKEDLENLVDRHCNAFKYSNARMMSMIEYRLTDANFHSLCRMLYEHNYTGAKAWIEEEMQ